MSRGTTPAGQPGQRDRDIASLKATQCPHPAGIARGDQTGTPGGGTGQIEIVLPYPISANRYWRSIVPKGWTRAVVHVSAEAEEYKQQVLYLAEQAGLTQPLAGRNVVLLQLYPTRPADWAKRAAEDPFGWDDDVQSLDADNAVKVLVDSLKGTVIVNDSRRYVRKLTIEHMEPDAHGPRCVVQVTPIPRPVHPQGQLL